MKPSKPPLYEEGGLFAAVGTGGQCPPLRILSQLRWVNVGAAIGRPPDTYDQKTAA